VAVAGTVLLIAAGVGIYAWLILRRLGVGQPGGKPDCGCGSGKACKTKKVRP
jgi:hypothetical protein